jgi:hypothetical protein
MKLEIRETGKRRERRQLPPPQDPANAVMETFDTILLERGTPSIVVDIEGVNRRLILDTGSNISIMQPGISRGDVRATA